MTVVGGVIVEERTNRNITANSITNYTHQPSRAAVVKEILERPSLLARRVYTGTDSTAIVSALFPVLLDSITCFEDAAQITQAVLPKKETLQIGKLIVTYYSLE
jgi:hypothetical protein